MRSNGGGSESNGRKLVLLRNYARKCAVHSFHYCLLKELALIEVLRAPFFR